VTSRRVTDDDCLHSVDSVHADNLGTGDDPELTAAGTHGFNEGSPKASGCSRVGRTQDNEDALAALQRADSSRARGAAVARDDQVDRPDHCVRLAAGSLAATGPLSVRKNASSCRKSTRFSRSGRHSLWPVAAAGARLK